MLPHACRQLQRPLRVIDSAKLVSGHQPSALSSHSAQHNCAQQVAATRSPGGMQLMQAALAPLVGPHLVPHNVEWMLQWFKWMCMVAITLEAVAVTSTSPGLETLVTAMSYLTFMRGDLRSGPGVFYIAWCIAIVYILLMGSSRMLVFTSLR